MTQDRIDDETVAQLIRDTADGWTMPPVRLDAPSWRDRVRSPRARRIAGARSWSGRVGQAVTAAVVLTVVGALVAVVTTRPPLGPGKSPDPSTDASGAPSDAAQASPLPKLMLAGDLPQPANVLVATGGGFYADVDLETGSIGRELTSGGPGNAIQHDEDGSLLCLCVLESARADGTATTATVTLERYAADGSLESSDVVETFTGEPDPRGPPSTQSNYPPHVLVAAGYTVDGRFGLVGWSLRDHPAWRSGVLLVDLRDGTVVSRLQLPDVTTGEGSVRSVVQAPRVVGDAGPGRVVVARTIETWSSPDTEAASVVLDVDVSTADLSSAWSNLAPVPNTADCGDTVLRAGGLASGGVWLACFQYGAGTALVRRITDAGASLEDVALPGNAGILGDMLAVSADGSALFAWDPVASSLSRVDLATGEKTVGEGATATVDDGPLAALGDWLAPTVMAKAHLVGSIVVSPDGARVYAIGVRGSTTGPELSGSSGVFAFDADTLARVAHYPATADFVSLAVSRDGRYVYAAGLPDVDATGNRQFAQGASITVFSAIDGGVRLVAGQLGGGMLSFASPVLD